MALPNEAAGELSPSSRFLTGTAKLRRSVCAPVPSSFHKTGTLTFAPGATTKTITISVNGDSKKEADETFYFDLFDNSSNSVFTKSRGTGTILNDD